MTFGERLRECIVDADMSQKEVAAAVNRSRRTVAVAMSDGPISPRTKKQIAKLFPILSQYCA